MDKIITRLKEIAKQAGAQNGCRLYDFYRHRDRLQVFIDKPKEEINLKDCENVFHSLKFLIRSEFPEILEQKKLEVSSPGVEKRLREFWHFEEAIHKTIKVVTTSPVSSFDERTQRAIQSQSIKGKLLSVVPEKLELHDESRVWIVPFSKIKTAHRAFLLPKKKKSDKKIKKSNHKIKKRGQHNEFRITI